MNGRIEKKSVIIFVHGFGSSNSCWNQLISLLNQDERIIREFEFKFFEYTSGWFEFNPLRKIPPLHELSDSLRAFIDSPDFDDRELILVGHSQGGLVIQSYLAKMLEAAKGEILRNLRQVILLATPNLGSTFLSWIRKLLSKFFFFTPQERSLRVLDDGIAQIREIIIERIVGAKKRSSTTWPIPIHSFYGTRDGVVPSVSAKTPFTYVTALDADHFSIIRPKNDQDRCYIEFVEALLEPAGHAYIFEVDSYETIVTTEPNLSGKEYLCKYGNKSRDVQTDNVGYMERRVKFSRKNQCKLPFTLKYRATEEGGCVEYAASQENEAEPEEIGRYLDQGEEIIFKFTPEANKIYWMKVKTYGGFGIGNQYICFHLEKDGYCKTRYYKLDLTHYLSAGYVITKTPQLFFTLEDPAHHHVHQPKDPSTEVKPIRHDHSGIWEWEIKHVWEGLAYLYWEVIGTDNNEAK